eukprot:3802422-Alexandrium_andersonii.AAC.1
MPLAVVLVDVPAGGKRRRALGRPSAAAWHWAAPPRQVIGQVCELFGAGIVDFAHVAEELA